MVTVKMILKSILVLFFAVPICMAQTGKPQKSGFPFEREHALRKQGPAIGNNFPLVDYLSLDWELIPVESLKNKTLVIKIWYVGCKGCKQENPFLSKLTNSLMENDDVLFLSYSMSHEDKTRKYFDKNGDFGYETMLMKKAEVENKFNVATSPTHFIIKNGVLIEKFTYPVADESIFNWYQNRILEISKM
ncbi:TlpA family protein disulfide reductase [Aquiflexum sp.]|uniref:TlpA family protein disulfide reductase n=1 Tax=Aquiflexum sp. TaxID=1872584 RepID=UPI0035930703